ncbi:hypothetical protein KO02_15205 [Sphingobacterium sp. ML3W]|uniref:DUF7738 domain-containing protein n=1 Tax=Sphingobacterium sp. ML3W TaxID=1538644 RepID=UPI0004F837FC|nr:hypothetical protein [Sphingobacterium sp. ML3W]AIM37884.1 hypothetical protein KO02_15205 [Sphingobacterium sp. ML3W]
MFCVGLTACQPKPQKTIPLPIENALIKITDCGVTYSGKQLPFGENIEAWEKVLGQKSSRPLFGMFDDLGVAVSIDDTSDKEAAFYIFFTNLDSPEGKAGELSRAHSVNMKPFETIEKEYKAANLPMTETLKAQIKKDLEETYNPEQYFYPYHTFKGVVNVQGVPISGDMNLQKINEYREQTKKLDIFTFWDRNVNMIDETLTTEGKDGVYFQVTDKECNGKLYRIVLFFTNYKLEYIRVQNLSKSYMEMLKKLEE